MRMSKLFIVTVGTICIAAAMSWIAVARLGNVGGLGASEAPKAGRPRAPASDQQEESLEILSRRLTTKERETVQRETDSEHRAFYTRVFAYRDRITGAEHETRFAVEAIDRFLEPGGRSAADGVHYEQLRAFISLGFLSRAEVQVGLPERHRTLVRGMCKKLAETRDEEIMLMTAAFLHATQARAELEPSLKVLFDSLKQNEMVEAELPIQIRVLEEARHARKK